MRRHFLTAAAALVAAFFMPALAPAQVGGNVPFGVPLTTNNPNFLINGAMDLDQPNEGAAVTLPDTGGSAGIRNGPDGWEAINQSTAVTGTTTIQRVASTLPGSAYALRYSIGTGGTIAAGDYGNAYQVIAGNDLIDMGWGTSAALPAYVSGSMNCSVAGSFSVQLQDGNYSVTFVHMVSVPAVNVETPFSFPVAGPTIGTFSTAHYSGVLSVTAYAGSALWTSTPDVWQTGTFATTSAQTQLSATTGAHCQITAMKLEKGSVATPFVHESSSDLLAKAQRRYWKTFPPGTVPAQNAGLGGAACVIAPVANSVVSLNFRPPAPMWRTLGDMFYPTPTVTTYNPSAANANWRDVTGSADIAATVDPSTAIGPTGVEVTSASEATLGHNLCIHAVLDGSLQ